MLDKFGINLPFLVLHIVHFFILMTLLNKLLFGRILEMLDKRESSIADSMAEAERVSGQAAEERAKLEAQIADERRDSQVKLREAVAASQAAAERRTTEAEEEAKVIVSTARTDAEKARSEALNGMQGEIAELALSAAGKVLGEGIDESKHRSLIDSFLKNELGELA